MDDENVTTVEMKALAPDAPEDEMEGITAKNEEEEGEVEEKGAHVYSPLKAPTEEVSCLTKIPVSPAKANEDVYRRLRLYKWISVVLTLLSVVLLAVVFALAMKLSEVQTNQQCPERPEFGVSGDFKCSRKLCKSMFPYLQAAQHSANYCPYCGKGWIMYEKTCYYKSKERLNWDESRKECRNNGGDLVVISSENVQKFLTEIGGQMFWIGLRYVQKHWEWINGSVVQNSYWVKPPNPDTGDICAFLEGYTPSNNNWHAYSCDAISHYICQKE